MKMTTQNQNYNKRQGLEITKKNQKKKKKKQNKKQKLDSI